MAKEMKTYGTNITGSIDGNILTLHIDLSQKFGESGSGKSEIIATTNGNIPVRDNIKLGVNCYTPIKKR